MKPDNRPTSDLSSIGRVTIGGMMNEGLARVYDGSTGILHLWVGKPRHGGGGVGQGIEILMDHLTQGKSGNGKNARTM